MLHILNSEHRYACSDLFISCKAALDDAYDGGEVYAQKFEAENGDYWEVSLDKDKYKKPVKIDNEQEFKFYWSEGFDDDAAGLLEKEIKEHWDEKDTVFTLSCDDGDGDGVDWHDYNGVRRSDFF